MQRRHPNCGIFLLKIMVKLIKILLYKIGTALPGKVANFIVGQSVIRRNPVLMNRTRQSIYPVLKPTQAERFLKAGA